MHVKGFAVEQVCDSVPPMAGRQATYYSSELLRELNRRALYTDEVAAAAIVRHALFAFWSGHASYVRPVLEKVLKDHGVGSTVSRRIFRELVADGLLTDDNNPAADPEEHLEVPVVSPLAVALRRKLEGVSSLTRRDIDAVLFAVTGLETRDPQQDEAALVGDVRGALQGVEKLRPALLNRLLTVVEDDVRRERETPATARIRAALEPLQLSEDIVARLVTTLGEEIA